MDGAIDVMLMSVHAGDRKGGGIDVFLALIFDETLTKKFYK